MNLPPILAALEKKLIALGAFPTAYENTSFTPVAGVPYQRVNHLLNQPIDWTLTSDIVEQRGLFQITLLYPLGMGRVPAMQRAQAIADHFKPVQHLIEGAVTVELNRTAKVSGGMVDGDRWAVPVTIDWRAFFTD